MRIAVLGSVESWYVRDLRRAGEEKGHQVVAVPFRGLRGWVDNGATPLDALTAEAQQSVQLSHADAVLVRTMPPGTLEQVVFRMDALHRLDAAGVPVLNPPRAIETAIDKYLASAKLASAGLPTPPTAACETAEQAMDAFARLGGDVVIKPLFGSEGRGITRVSDPDLAYRAFRALEQWGMVIYQQPFIKHFGHDLRVLVLDGQVIGSMQRRARADWRTNVSRGAKAEAVLLSDHQSRLAIAAAERVQVPFAGVDLLPAVDGRCYVLEVNAVPGWRALAQVTGVDIAAAVVASLRERM